jgi:hypothetical protein
MTSGGEDVRPITVTVTSCRRPALLRTMLSSFRERCVDLERVARWICVDDGSAEADLAEVKRACPWLEVIRNEPGRGGHPASIRRLWAEVDTELVFHTEDDWRFEEDFSFADLEAAMGRADQLALRWEGRDIDRTFNPRHPFIEGEIEAIAQRLGYTTRPKQDGGWWWPGFTLNPSLLRLDRVRELVPEVPAGPHFEFEYALRLHRMGFRVRHRPQVFTHVGEVSAYILAGVPRPSDMRELAERVVATCVRDPTHALKLAGHLESEALDDESACRAGLAVATAQWYTDREAGRETLRALWRRRHSSGFLFSVDAENLLRHYGETWESLLGHEGAGDDLEDALARPVADRARLRQRKRSMEHQPHFQLPSSPPRIEGGAGVTLAMTSCRRLDLLLRTVAAFVACCSDHPLVDRWICVDDGSDDEDRRVMAERLPWFEFVWKGPADRGHARSLQILQQTIVTPYVLLLEDDQELFVPSDYIARCLHGLSVGTSIGQCLINVNYAEDLDDYDITGGMPFQHEGRAYVAHLYDPERRVVEGVSNCHWPHFSLRPGLSRLDAWDLGFRDVPFFEREFASRYTAAGWRTIFLPDISHRHIGRRLGADGDNAYALNRMPQF